MDPLVGNSVCSFGVSRNSPSFRGVNSRSIGTLGGCSIPGSFPLTAGALPFGWFRRWSGCVVSRSPMEAPRQAGSVDIPRRAESGPFRPCHRQTTGRGAVCNNMHDKSRPSLFVVDGTGKERSGLPIYAHFMALVLLIREITAPI